MTSPLSHDAYCALLILAAVAAMVMVGVFAGLLAQRWHRRKDGAR